MKGLRVSVYRDASGMDCTLGGLTSRYTDLTLCGEGVPEIFEADEKAPAVILRRNKAHLGGYLYATPAGSDPIIYAYGGNFVSCSDSRFREIAGVALPIHDRNLWLEK